MEAWGPLSLSCLPNFTRGENIGRFDDAQWQKSNSRGVFHERVYVYNLDTRDIHTLILRVIVMEKLCLVLISVQSDRPDSFPEVDLFYSPHSLRFPCISGVADRQMRVVPHGPRPDKLTTSLSRGKMQSLQSNQGQALAGYYYAHIA